MQSRMEDSVRTKMEKIRLECDRENQQIDAAAVSFRKALESTKETARETVQVQAKIGKLKAELREAEDGLVKALAALSACEEKCNKNNEDRGEIEEAISWYNRILGFRIECGHGVKFIFTNINVNNPEEKYSFSIRHERELYTLLDCDPHLNDTKELLHELNRNNSLFKFVRTMREKFRDAAAHGNFPQVTTLDQHCSTINVSAPASSVSIDSGSESASNPKEIQPGETNRQSKKVNYGRAGKPTILSPRSASSLRRSPRFKVKK
ncbi:hypothetical protein U1Q18_027365 [Sarracenia purpurea var. burkii]